MASSSRSLAATYQVFLSFRGPDTRQGFTDVLYHALKDAGIRVFRDNEEIRKGEEISEEILRAIKESVIFVPIFSRRYASSKWCLLELTKMVESLKGSSGKKILPIFYDVCVDDVKLKTDLYSKTLEEHLQKFGTETVKLWEEALRQAGKFKGWELKDKGYAEFIKLVVRDVSMKLKVKHKCVTEYLVQRDGQIEALMKLLDCDSSEVRFVGILGMGGIGKTTLARVVFNKLCDHFDGCSFLANVRESSGQYKGIDSLQEQLLKGLVIKLDDIMDVGDRIIRLRETLGSKKVLIVLDDVDSKDQIHNLAGDASWFGRGSRIIITTRDQRVLEIRRLRIQALNVEELKPEEASRLFCMHAFGKDSPPDDYLSLLKEAVQSTGGLPLALAVIGSLLGDKPRQEWSDIIERLKKVPHKDVQKQLMISYEALSDKSKQIFLDIACFFIGRETECPIYMWQACDFDPKMGLKELIYMSLVKVIEDEDESQMDGKRKTLWMHDQLRDLGRAIVNRKSFEDGVKPSRFSFRKDTSEMLHGEEDNRQVEMLRFQYGRYTFTHKEISSFQKLRYLECYRANFSGELRNTLPKLRWLSWSWCPPEFMGTGILFRNLVILDLSCSDIDDNWSGWIQIGVGTTLKVLDLRGCRNLRRTPDLSTYSCLERLILSYCTKLVEIDPSIGKLARLRHLSLAHSHRLSVLPDTLGNLENLRVMGMGDTMIKELPSSFGMLKRLEELHASHTPLEEIPLTFEGLTCLKVLKLQYTHLWLLPPKIPMGLTDVEISSFSILETVPKFTNLQNLVRLVLLDDLFELGSSEVRPIELQGVGKLRSLVELDLDLWNVTCIPEELSSLPQLQKLTLGCPNLHCCPPLPSTLSDLSLQKHMEKTKLPGLSNLKNLLTLKLWWSSLSEDAVGNLGVGELESLMSLSLIDCKFGNLDVLRLPGNLHELNIQRCKSLEALPTLSHLKNLKRLSIDGAEELVEIPELGELDSLQELSIRYCRSIETLPDMSKLKMLRRIKIESCRRLKSIDSITLPRKTQEQSRKRPIEDLYR